MSRPIDAVVAGHICFDVIPTFTREETDVAKLFRPGSLLNMGGLATSTGGPVSNTGIALKILGLNVELMGKVGDDFIGKALIDALKVRDADKGMIVIPGEETSYTIVMRPLGLDRMFLHNPGANNTFSSADVRWDVVEKARLFHLGYPPLMRAIHENGGRELASIMKHARELGVTTSLDMSLPDPASPSGRLDWVEVLENVLPHVDIFVPSSEETLFMIERETYNQRMEEAAGRDLLELMTAEDVLRIGRKVLAMGPGVVEMKSGYKGIHILTAGRERLDNFGAAKAGEGWADRELWEPSFHVPEVAGATGSGDSSIAGFLGAFLRGMSIEESLKMANAVGGRNVTAPDALSGILSWDETMKLVVDGWVKNKLAVDVAGWEWVEEFQHFRGPNDAGATSSGVGFLKELQPVLAIS